MIQIICDTRSYFDTSGKLMAGIGRETLVAITKVKLALGPANKSSTANSKVTAANARWRRSLASDEAVAVYSLPITSKITRTTSSNPPGP